MIATFWMCIAAVILAAVLDIAANVLVARSEGFSVKRYGFGALGLVFLAFTCLAFAVRGLDLSVAYAMWGALGVLGTSLMGWLFLGQRLRAPAWLGIALVAGGISLLHLGG